MKGKTFVAALAFAAINIALAPLFNWIFDTPESAKDIVAGALLPTIIFYALVQWWTMRARPQ